MSKEGSVVYVVPSAWRRRGLYHHDKCCSRVITGDGWLSRHRHNTAAPAGLEESTRAGLRPCPLCAVGRVRP